MVVNRECSVCKEDALYYCRMCITHYCVEHLCMHLSVAQEENSYTNRTEEIEDENKDIRTRVADLGIFDKERELDEPNKISLDEKSLESYSEAQLREQLDFHSNQSRRIRFELERRAVLVQSPEERASFKQYHRPKRNYPRQRTIPKGAVHATQLVLNQLRSNNISLEYIIARMNAFKK